MMNTHPDATIIETVSELTGAHVVMTTPQAKGNHVVYVGCIVLPFGQDVDRKILNVQCK